MRDQPGKRSTTSSSPPGMHAAAPAPGKRTRVEQVSSAVVQQRAGASHDPAVIDPSPANRPAPAAEGQLQRLFGRREPGATDSPGSPAVQLRADGPAHEDIHAAAARGIETPETRLPFADQIQASFGAANDVRSIQAHVGGPAAEAASAMGATAYATGNHTVFAGAPDLHTAAHEAAHVVQQRDGVHLAGGVGQAGDAYERHADAVADRVVQGKSAADLLGPGTQAASPSGPDGAIQHSCSECGSAVSPGGECTSCNSRPDAGGGRPVQRSDDPAQAPGGPASAGAGGPASAPQPAGSTPAGGAGPAPSTWGWGGDATRNVYATCDIGEMDRASYLAFEAGVVAQGAKRAGPAQAQGGFGITSSTVTTAKPPPIEAESFQDGGTTKYRLKPTHAEMAAVQSAVTKVCSFVEGVIHWVNQNAGDCQSGKYPIRWVLTPAAVAKIKQGEHEHCDDFRAAFDNSLVVFAATINNVAAANRTYSSEKEAIGDALSSLGMSQPDEMMQRYAALARRTLTRDRSAHTPTLPPHMHPDDGCSEVKIVLGDSSFPGIPGPSSDSVVNP